MNSHSIAEKNDLMRKTLIGCKVMLTASVAESPLRDEILNAVRAFRDFNESNDPYGEHDFAFIYVGGERWFFKFDYFDNNYAFFQEDGRRVLTIGHASDY